jgi:hypothetical protein
LERIETGTAGVPSLPMNHIWSTIRGYIFWSYERGTIQFDVMVTLILIFIFFSPYVINFNDKPIEHNPHPTGVVIEPDGSGGFVYEIDASAVAGQNDAAIRASLLRVIEPIAGEVSIKKYEAVLDRGKQVRSYRVWVEK